MESNLTSSHELRFQKDRKQLLFQCLKVALDYYLKTAHSSPRIAHSYQKIIHLISRVRVALVERAPPMCENQRVMLWHVPVHLVQELHSCKGSRVYIIIVFKCNTKKGRKKMDQFVCFCIGTNFTFTCSKNSALMKHLYILNEW
jgi:hypothetical protein